MPSVPPEMSRRSNSSIMLVASSSSSSRISSSASSSLSSPSWYSHLQNLVSRVVPIRRSSWHELKEWQSRSRPCFVVSESVSYCERAWPPFNCTRLRLLRLGSCEEQRADSLCIRSRSRHITSTIPMVWTWYHWSRHHQFLFGAWWNWPTRSTLIDAYSSLYLKDGRLPLLTAGWARLSLIKEILRQVGSDWDSHLAK